MCIDIKKRIHSLKEGEGYKEFMIRRGRLSFSCMINKRLYIGKWLDAKDPIHGFHILKWRTRPKWINDPVIKVKYRKARWEGRDAGSHRGKPIIVAWKLYIPIAELRKKLIPRYGVKEAEKIINRSKHPSKRKKK